jgi:hypothetical protein
LVDLTGFDEFADKVRWVGVPAESQEGADPKQTFLAAILQCEPEFRDWTVLGLFHVFGAEIVPSSEYDVQLVDISCVDMLDNEACYAEQLRIQTAKWGDIVFPFEGSDAAQPDFSDIAALVAKFAGDPNAPVKARTQLYQNVLDPSRPVDFNDIAAVVDAFTGQPYPFAGPSSCP